MGLSAKRFPAIQLKTAARSGCFISVSNSTSPTVENILVDYIVPREYANLRFSAVRGCLTLKDNID